MESLLKKSQIEQIKPEYTFDIGLFEDHYFVYDSSLPDAPNWAKSWSPNEVQEGKNTRCSSVKLIRALYHFKDILLTPFTTKHYQQLTLDTREITTLCYSQTFLRKLKELKNKKKSDKKK